MRKADLRQRRVVKLPAQMIFHVGNAFERADGNVSLSFVGSPHTQFLRQGAVAVLRGEPSVAGHASTQLVELNLKTGRATLMGMVDMVESPQVDPRRVGQAARHLPSTSTWKGDAGSRGSHHGVQRLDVVGGKLRRFDYGDHMVVEKHLMVPRRGREAELDAMYWTLQALETGRWRRQRCRTNCRLRFIGTSPYNFQAKLLFAPSPLKGR